MHFPRSLRRPASVVGALSFFCTACVYPVRYVDDLAPGNHVVLALTDQGIPDMAPKLGQGVFLVGGVVQGIDQTNVTVAVQRTESTRGVQYGVHPEIVQWNGDVVPVPRACPTFSAGFSKAAVWKRIIPRTRSRKWLPG